MTPEMRSLYDAATCRFMPAGKYAWYFSRGKLRLDPVFFNVLGRGLFPARGTLVDLGCGQGSLLSLLVSAREQYQRGLWPAGWPPPPLDLELRGVELRADRASAARAALGGAATIEQADMRGFVFPRCSVIVILDVLLYLAPAEQDRLLGRIAAALEPGGLLLLREADAGGGLAFYITQWGERLAGSFRGRLWQRLTYRRTSAWLELLARHGFDACAEPMSHGTPFSNVLFVARKERTVEVAQEMVALPSVNMSEAAPAVLPA